MRTRRVAFLLLAFSAGLGWLVAPLGVITADLWVVEGFTFLTILVNPHFPLAIGLMLLIFLQVLDLRAAGNATRQWAALGCAGLGLALAVVQPFAVPIVLAILAVYLAALAVQSRRLPWGEILLAGIVAAGCSAGHRLRFLCLSHQPGYDCPGDPGRESVAPALELCPELWSHHRAGHCRHPDHAAPPPAG